MSSCLSDPGTSGYPIAQISDRDACSWGCGAASPRSGCIWKQLQRRELEPQGEGARAYSPQPRKKRRKKKKERKKPPGQGSLPLRGQDPRDQSGGAGRWIPAIGGARSIRALPPGSGGRGRAGRARARRLCAIRRAAAAGKGPVALRCAALLPPGAEAPGEGSAGPSSRPLGCTPAPRLARRTPPRGRDGFPGFPSYVGPAWGSLCVHLCFPPQGRGQFGLRSSKPGRGCFRLPGWEIPAVAMAPGTCCGGRPPAAPRGVPRIPSCTALLAAPSYPAFASHPIGPPRLT